MQLLFHLVYYHSTCFGHGSCPSSGVIQKTVELRKLHATVQQQHSDTQERTNMV